MQIHADILSLFFAFSLPNKFESVSLTVEYNQSKNLQILNFRSQLKCVYIQLGEKIIDQNLAQKKGLWRIL